MGDKIFGGPTLHQMRAALFETELDETKEELDVLKILKQQTERERDRLQERVSVLEAEKAAREKEEMTGHHERTAEANADKKLNTQLREALQSLVDVSPSLGAVGEAGGDRDRYSDAYLNAAELLETIKKQEAK